MPEVDGFFWQKVLQSGNNCVTIIFNKRDFGCCTFPMRDWNEYKVEYKLGSIFELYLSYEGLKPSAASISACNSYAGCTFPMRDWNLNGALSAKASALRVVPFLWGIETWPPYLALLSKLQLLYLSYEGLKHMTMNSFLRIRCLFKLYLSYEGLKLYDSFNLMNHFVLCCTFPMRDWNSYKTAVTTAEAASCTFPMRDWNLFNKVIFILHVIQVVPFLWGIETRFLVLFVRRPPISCTFPMRDWNQ